MSFEEAGIRLTVKGADDFFGSLKSAEKAVADFGTNVGKQANLTGFSQDIKSASDALKGMASPANAAAKAVQGMGTAHAAAAAQASTFSSAVNTSKTAASGGSGAFTAAAGALGTFGGAVGAAAGKLGSLVADTAVNSIKGLAGAAGSAVGALGSLASAAGGAVVGGLKGIASAAGEALTKIASLAVDGLKHIGSLAAGFGKTSVDKFTDFSAKISGIAAVSGATSEQLQQMSDKALELGAKFPVSASQAADAMQNLASAGFSASDAIAASQSVVVLAGAGQLDMAKSADILSSSMNGFGLITQDTNKNIAEAARVTDLMAATANASAVSIQDIGYTMKYVAPVAQAAGYSIEDMSTAIGMMGNAGIKGSSAGTALRSIVTSFAAPTAAAASAFDDLGVKTQDSTGKMRPFGDVIGDMRAKFKDLSQADKIDLAKKIAGKEAMSSLLAIVDSSDASYKSMQDSINGASGAASEMAKTMSDNLQGKLDNMQGSVETLQIKLGQALAPAVGLVYDAIANLANQLGPFATQIGPVVSGAVQTLINTLGDAKKGFDLFLGAFNSGFVVPPAWDGLAATMGRLGTALAPLKQAFSDLVTAILPAQTPLDAAVTGMNGMGTAASNAHPVIDAISGLVTNFLVPGIEKAATIVNDLQTAFGAAQTALAPFLPTIGDLANKALTVYENISPLNIALTAFEGFMSGGLPGMVTALGGNVTNLGNAFGVDLSGPVKIVTEFLINDLVPGVTGVVNAVVGALPGIISFGQAFLNQVLPPIQNTISWISANVGPVITSAFDTLTTTVIPALGRFADYFGNTVMPKIGEFVSYVGEKIGPVLSKGFDIIATDVIPTIGKLVGVITDNVIPTLMTWWSIIATVLQPAFDVIVGAISNVFLPAVQGIWQFINDPLIPIFQSIADVMQSTVLPALQGAADFFNNTLKAAIDNIVKVWDNMTGRIKSGADFIGDIFKGDLTAASNDLGKVINGDTDKMAQDMGNAATAGGTWASQTTTDTGTMSSDWGGLATDVTTQTGNIDTAVTTSATNVTTQSGIAGSGLSDWGTATADVGTKSTDAAGKVGNLSTAASSSVTPSNNAKSAASGASGAFNDVGTSAGNATTKIGDYNNKTVAEKDVKHGFNAAANAIQDAINKLNSWNNTTPQSKTVTYTTNYKNTGAPGPVPNALGTNSFVGGAATVAEKGPEMIKSPGQPSWLAMQPMYIPDLAKGSKVYTADKTAQLIGGRTDLQASGGQMMGSVYNNQQTTNQNILNVNSIRSTESIVADFALLEVMS